MRIVKKPWGHEEIWAETDKYLGKILYIDKGHRLSLQYHEKKVETIRVLQGKLMLVIQEGETVHSSTRRWSRATHIMWVWARSTDSAHLMKM